MLQTVTHEPLGRALEFGIYRDGDNDLDEVQADVLRQSVRVSARNPQIEFLVEDTTARRGFAPRHVLRTENYSIAGGRYSREVAIGPPHDMSDRDNLARFVARTLDRAQARDAGQTWIELVDHGAGDAGGLEADHGMGVMREDDIAGAIADGVAAHARRHPEDAGRGVDGVVANECLAATLGFSSALSHAGVRYLAASPEVMLAPGAPTSVAEPIARHQDDPVAMAKGIVAKTMRSRYDEGDGTFAPAAAFDVLDLAPDKIAQMETSVRKLNDAIAVAAHDRTARAAMREDGRSHEGMARFFRGGRLPWRADRPALPLYETLSGDERVPATVRNGAKAAAAAVSSLILAHGESNAFEPFGNQTYADAVGPTVHFPLTPRQIDAWAPDIAETDNAFHARVHGESQWVLA